MTAEEYIKAYTRGNSNELVYGGYHEWLTPENALAAVELAREEFKKDAIGGFIEGEMGRQEDEPNEVYVVSDSLDTTKFKIGDKVKVIIIKE